MTKTVLDAVTAFRTAQNFDLNEERRCIWMAQLGSYILPLPNFKWRRDIISRHDAHHVLTGYEASTSGELCLAAWEVGAHCFDDWRAQTLCRLLLLLGYISQPQLTHKAYHKGRRQAAAYQGLKAEDFLNRPWAPVQATLNQSSTSYFL